MLDRVQETSTEVADRASPFGDLSVLTGQGLRITERRGLAIVEIAAFARGTDVAGAPSEALGIALPAAGGSVEAGTLAALSIGPGRWLLIGPQSGAASLPALPADQAAVTDLSHGRAVLSLTNLRAVHTLTKGTAVDLASAIFPPGAVAATALARMPVIIWRRQTAYDVIVARSYAVSLLEWLIEAGQLS